MELLAGGMSDVGVVRSANQDSWLISDRLWAVADGMGGHQGGEVASQLTIEVLADRFDDYSEARLVGAAQDANAAVHAKASEHADLRGMGTTLCAMALVDIDDDAQIFAVINVGDSRCYRWRDGEMTQITRDHSLVEDMRAAGQITEAEAAVHPHRNIVTRALGIQPRVKVDSFPVTPMAGDRFILCSDGLFNEVNSDRIAATLRRLGDPQEAAEDLVRQANQAGGRDNVTCVIVDVLDATGAPTGQDAPLETFTSASSVERPPDMAGITSAMPVVQDDAPDVGDDTSTTHGLDAVDTEPKVRLRRVTWRTFVFAIVLVGILGAAAAAVGWYGRGSYFVGFQADQVTVFKGRPGKILWLEPTVARRTGIAKAQVPASMRDTVTKGRQQATLGDADAYVARMRSVICSDLRNGGKLPAAKPGAPTTTLPKQCDDLNTPTPAPTTASPTTTTP